MITYRWTPKDLYDAADYVNQQYVEEGGVPIEVRDVRVESLKCRLGGQSLRFTLRFSGSTAKRKDGTYPVGAHYRERLVSVYVKDIMPACELEGFSSEYKQGLRVKTVTQTRGRVVCAGMRSGILWNTFLRSLIMGTFRLALVVTMDRPIFVTPLGLNLVMI